MDKQINLFDVDTFFNKFFKQNFRSKYLKWKFINQYKKAENNKCCKNCKHLIKSKYYKCELLGISNSTATDIRLSNTCIQFEPLM